MPVEDIPVHPKVKHEKPVSGCYNSGTASDGYWAQDGWEDEWGSSSIDGTDAVIRRTARFVWIPHTMSTKCRQTLPLPECEGCKAEKDVEYIKRMGAMA